MNQIEIQALTEELELAFHLHKGNNLNEAEVVYCNILDRLPNNLNVLLLYGTLLGQKEDFIQALIVLHRALEVDPNNVIALNNMGIALKRLGQIDDAFVVLEKAKSIDSSHHDTIYNLGNLYKDKGKYEIALEHFNSSITIKDGFADSYLNRGFVLEKLGLLEESIESYRQASQLQPFNSQIFINLGNVEIKLLQVNQAELYYLKAISINPQSFEAYTNLGNLYKEQNQLDKALNCFNQAIGIDPLNSKALNNRAMLHKDLLQLDQSLVDSLKALKIEPENPKCHWNLSLTQLLMGNFKDGFTEYEWRWRDEEASKISGKRKFTQPLWLGLENLNNKTLLIYAEQGLGDTIQFCRYLSHLKSLGAKLIFEVQQPLKSLFSSLNLADETYASGEYIGPYDFQCPLMSLPFIFNTEMGTVPPITPFPIHEVSFAKWRAILGSKTKPRIGIVWTGGTTHKEDAKRSISLSVFSQIFKDTSLSNYYEFYCLQKEIRETDRILLDDFSQIKVLIKDEHDFIDTKALCEHMDMIISVDTSVAHLAATLNKPTLIPVPFSPDWRWLLDRDNSPWYPTVKLYRQSQINNWDEPLRKIVNELLELKDFLYDKLEHHE